MKTVSGKDFTKILELHGWTLARIHGSHHIYVKKGRTERISVPVHGTKNLKLGLLRHLMKLADLKNSDL